MLIERLLGLLGKRILAQGADGYGVLTAQELPGMIGEVSRSTTQFLSFGEAVPQYLTQSDYVLFHRYVIF